MRIYRLMIWITSLSAMAVPAAATAQAADSSKYVIAQQMVANGDAARGRRLVDSLLKATPTGSAQYAEGLYWRATLASNARDSERDYRQIVVDYPLSPRVPDALLRMGEMESQRGDREAALQHFQRLTIEHPESPLRAEASYWIARTYLEKNDTAHGCAANADAMAQASASNVELKNRIEYQQQACRGVAVSAAPVTAPATKPVTRPATPSAAAATAPVATATETPVPREVPVKTAPVQPDREPAESVAATPAPATAATTTTATTAATATTKAAAKAAAKVAPKVAVRPAAESAMAAPKRAPAPRRAETAAAARASAAGGYAVQVAAFRSRTEAEALANKLRTRGYSAHVDGVDAPFRVRIGHYATRAAAVAELRQLKAKKMDGFIAEL